MTDLNLIARKLEEAAEGSRELDGVIWKACEEKPGDDWQMMSGAWHRRDPDDYVAFDTPPSLTSSIDAALALVDRIYPDRPRRTDITELVLPNSRRYSVTLQIGSHAPDAATGNADTLPVAICLALIRALIAKEGR